MPQTSVLISTYNCGKFIKEALDSIISQRYKDYQIIVIDDGSTDDTENIIDGYKNIRYHKNDGNLGISTSLNTGISMCDSEYIARMDADDIMMGHRLRDQIGFLNDHRDHGLVGSWYHVMSEEGIIHNLITPFTSHDDIRVALIFQNQFAQSAVTGRTSLFHELGYDPVYTCAEDHDLWIRFSERCKVANLPNYHLSYRWHASNTCNTKQANLKLMIATLLSRELDKIEVDHSNEELMLHSAIIFGMGPRMSKIEDRRSKIIKWYDKIFASHVLKSRYPQSTLDNYRRVFLLRFAGIH